MKRIRFILAVVGGMGLQACAYFHHPDNDALAASAYKAIQDSQLGASLTAERAAVVDRGKRKLEAVRRDQLAMRDRELALYLDGTSREYTSGAFSRAVSNRLTQLIG